MKFGWHRLKLTIPAGEMLMEKRERIEYRWLRKHLQHTYAERRNDHHERFDFGIDGKY